MKTFLMSIPDSIRGISDKLNIKSLLCDKSWVVFNDEDSKIVFIFEKNGTMIISQNGVVKKGKWDYVKANKSILLEEDNQILLLHPAFVDGTLFVMQQDGTDYCAVLCDEQKVNQLMLVTLESINQYLMDVAMSNDAAYVEQKRKEELKRKREEMQHEKELREKAYEMAKDEIEAAKAELERKKNQHKKVFIALQVVFVFLIVLSFQFDEVLIVIFGLALDVMLWLTLISTINMDKEDLKEKLIVKYIPEAEKLLDEK